MAAGRFKQLKLLLWKNWLFSVRSWKSTVLQLLAPCFFIVLATILSNLPQGLEDDSSPVAKAIGTLPKCNAWNGQSCTSLVVMVPNNPALLNCVNNLMNDFLEESKFINDSDVVMYVIGLSELQSNTTEVIEKLQKQFTSNVTQVGVLFTTCNTIYPALTYTIFFNSSRALKFQQLVFGSPSKPDGRIELALALDRLFMGRVLGKNVRIAVNVSTFPVFYQQESMQSKQAVSATVFIFCAITVQFVMLLYNVVSEKDLKLRQGLKLIGLKDSVYWISWAITASVIAFISTCVLMATGYACQLQFFFNTNFLINFLLFLLYSISMIPLAFFTTVFITTVRAAVNCGMVVFVVGMMVISLLGNPFLLTQLYEYVKPLVYVLSLLPPFHLAKAMADIGDASSDTDMNGLPKQIEYFGWHSLFKKRLVRNFGFSDGDVSSHYFEMPSTYLSLVGLLLITVLYGILSWYLDAVIQGNHGIPRKWHFFVNPSYWFEWLPFYDHYGLRDHLGLVETESVQVAQTTDENGLKCVDIGNRVSEKSTLLNNENGCGNHTSRHALWIDHLKKSFPGSCACVGKAVKPAVDGLTLFAEDNQILALLGHNGAGKTTTINMLIGLLEPDEGDAYFYNISVRREIDRIRNVLGVCPQHDILWGDLTAMEHMKLFGNLKGLSSQSIENEITTLLTDVQLINVAHNPVKTYSGGMKRSLSVALSFLGNPKILFLDEPTTGMDPKIRRDIWNVILRMKQKRVIIMTTHSMEEADILGDNIAIMANGRLKVMGTSVKLKNSFAGYKVEVVVKADYVTQMMDIFRDKLPGATKRAEPFDVEGGGVLLAYSLAPESHDEVVPFFEVIEKNTEVANTVLDYSISQTTLEEVFLNVTMNELFRDTTYKPLLVTSASYSASSRCTSAVSPTLKQQGFVSGSHSIKT